MESGVTAKYSSASALVNATFQIIPFEDCSGVAHLGSNDINVANDFYAIRSIGVPKAVAWPLGTSLHLLCCRSLWIQPMNPAPEDKPATATTGRSDLAVFPSS